MKNPVFRTSPGSHLVPIFLTLLVFLAAIFPDAMAAGTPLTVIGTYDSRDAKGGDFGPGR